LLYRNYLFFSSHLLKTICHTTIFNEIVFDKDKLPMKVCFILLSVLFCAVSADALSVTAGKDIAACGEKISFTITRTQRKLALYPAVKCTLYNGDKVLETFHLDGKGTHTFSLTAPETPGWIYAKAEYIGSDGKTLPARRYKDNRGAGTLIAPEKISSAYPEPDDFDDFWAKEIAALRSVKMEVSRPAVTSKVPGVRAEDVRINTNTSIPVSGFLLIPENAPAKSLPAIIYFHGAGVRSAIKQTYFAKRAIVFDVNAHGVENGHPAEYYKKLASTELKRVIYRGSNDPANSYIKNMFLRTVRAADFIRTLPEWDGRTLIVFGRSQGGAQALAAAALVPEITLCVANVPALADHAGFTAGRQPGWPNLCRKQKTLLYASSYTDVANLASRIRAAPA